MWTYRLSFNLISIIFCSWNSIAIHTYNIQKKPGKEDDVTKKGIQFEDILLELVR